LFFSFTELVLGVVVFNISGGIQIALATFAITFPLWHSLGIKGQKIGEDI